ncbi:MAG: Hsp20/alpha crystallin family protein [Pseudomonadota bacterium]
MVNALLRSADHWGRDFDALWDDVFRPVRVRAANTASAQWAPAMDVTETESGYDLRLEIPGVDKDAIDVSVHEGVVTISGEKPEAKDLKEGERVVRTERRYGAFQRAIQLGSNADPAKVKAAYRDGVLEVHVPKVEAATPRKVTVEEAA